MKKSFIFLLTLLLSIVPVLADHGYKSTSAATASFALFMILFFIFIFIIAVLGTVFWVFMLVDCAQREFDSKVAWILILALTGVIGAILYYFIVKRE